jgi:hypothetical protein
MIILWLSRLTSTVIVGLALAGMDAAPPAVASPVQIDWAVVNNFALLKGADTQERFEREVEAYLDCLRRTGLVLSCPQNQAAEGLTQRPYPVRFDRQTARYSADLVFPRFNAAEGRLSPSDRLRVHARVVDAPADARCTWTVDGHRHTGQPCSAVTITARLDTPVDVRVEVEGEPERAGATTITVRRRIILALGDSFMSGEGNPHRRHRVDPLRAELWLEERCHRSLLAASSLAALAFATANPKLYVAYLNVACSGSTVATGLLGPYEGVLPAQRIAAGKGLDDARDYYRGPKLPSQIDQAKAALCAGTGHNRICATPDLVWLGIGVNDLGFRQVVTTLAGSTCGKFCQAGLERALSPALERLRGDGPGSLARALAVIDRELKPKRAMTVGYPDPTKSDTGAPCDASVLGVRIGDIGRVDADENRWAVDAIVTPLNDALATAVRNRPGWGHLDGAFAATSRHGYCAKIPHFNSGLDANVEAGTMHPNALGHAVIARLMTEATRDLAGE